MMQRQKPQRFTWSNTKTPRLGRRSKQPMPIPLKTALIGNESGHEICPERLIVLDRGAAEASGSRT